MRLFSSIRCRTTSARLLNNDDGATAIEFAMVSLPFLFFVIGLIGYGLYFLTSSSLQYGVEAASRKVRTGEMNSIGAERSDKQMTVKEFRKLVCDAAGAPIDCKKLSVHVDHATDWSGISPPACTDENGNLAPSTGSEEELLTKYAGEASDVVLVTLCYRWDLAESFAFLELDNDDDSAGPAIIQAATAFKSEPYN